MRDIILGGCRFLDGNNRACGRPCRIGSSYCHDHHALTHIPVGSRAETVCVRAIERLATAVGGKTLGGKTRADMPPGFAARLDRLN
jgi:hypothetical protein